MVFALLRLFGVIWIFGFIVLAATSTSSYMFSSEDQPARSDRWAARLRMALVWPLAMLSSSGRARPCCAAGSFPARIEMKMMLSMPRTISSTVSVTRLIQRLGSVSDMGR